MIDVYADTTVDIQGNFSPAGKFSSIGQLATVFVDIIIIAAGVLAIIFVILAGIQIITAGGDAKKLGAAQSRLTFAIIGLAVTALAFVIVAYIQNLVGSTITIITIF